MNDEVSTLETTGTIQPATYWEDIDWVDEQASQLHRRYEDVWIAVADRQVVASGPSLARVKREASRRTGRPPQQITVVFIEGAGAIYGTG
jgi:hypothetical protein